MKLFGHYQLPKTAATMLWITRELQWRATRFVRTGYVNVFDGVVKSDTAISPALHQALQDATAGLVKPRRSNALNEYQAVVDPASYPLSFRDSRVLVDSNSKIGVEDCLLSVCSGSTIFLHKADPTASSPHRRAQTFPSDARPGTNIFEGYDLQSQYLPFDVSFTEEGCHIESYINGLHPREHSGLYEIIEKFIAQAVPLWNESLSQTRSNWKRLILDQVEFTEQIPVWGDRCSCTHLNDPEGVSIRYGCSICTSVYKKWVDTRHVVLPEPPVFSVSSKPPSNTVNLRPQYAKKGIQVILKIENVDLSPNGVRAGDIWHVEGALVSCSSIISVY